MAHDPKPPLRRTALKIKQRTRQARGGLDARHVKGELARHGILTFLAERQTTSPGYGASIRDIMAGCGISSTSVVQYHLNVLERNGLIRREHNVARSLCLTATPGAREAFAAGLEVIQVPEEEVQRLAEATRQALLRFYELQGLRGKFMHWDTRTQGHLDELPYLAQVVVATARRELEKRRNER